MCLQKIKITDYKLFLSKSALFYVLYWNENPQCEDTALCRIDNPTQNPLNKINNAKFTCWSNLLLPQNRHHEQTIRNKIFQMKNTLIFFLLFVIIIFRTCNVENKMVWLTHKLNYGLSGTPRKNRLFCKLNTFFHRFSKASEFFVTLKILHFRRGLRKLYTVT